MVKRAQSCLPVDFRYSLGCGGWDPKDALPATLVWRRPKGKFLPVKALWCDCSGFIAWVIGLSRKTTIHPKLWGISTTSIYRDATDAGHSKFFRLLAPGESAEAGDFIVYPDSYDPVSKRTKQGHVALIVEPASRTVIDCSSSVDGISRRVAGYWGKSTVVRFDPA
jgi:hypothetical protein